MWQLASDSESEAAQLILESLANAESILQLKKSGVTLEESGTEKDRKEKETQKGKEKEKEEEKEKKKEEEVVNSKEKVYPKDSSNSDMSKEKEEEKIYPKVKNDNGEVQEIEFTRERKKEADIGMKGSKASLGSDASEERMCN